MNIRHAVVWLDHQQARLLPLDAAQAEPRRLQAHRHPTAQHASAVRSEHEFFAAVCDALGDAAAVLAVGPHMALADFERYVAKHRPALMPRIAAFQVVDHPSDAQLLAQARAFFIAHDRMTGVPTPS